MSTSVESLDWDAAIQTGYSKLDSYMRGKNERGEDSKTVCLTVIYTVWSSPRAYPCVLAY